MWWQGSRRTDKGMLRAGAGNRTVVSEDWWRQCPKIVSGLRASCPLGEGDVVGVRTPGRAGADRTSRGGPGGSRDNGQGERPPKPNRPDHAGAHRTPMGRPHRDPGRGSGRWAWSRNPHWPSRASRGGRSRKRVARSEQLASWWFGTPPVAEPGRPENKINICCFGKLISLLIK